jgi:hypothetical protein
MKRPFSVTLMSFIFMIAGVSGIIYHADELKNMADDLNVLWVLVVRLAAIIGGWFAFSGSNWARWLLVLWICYHVFLSFYHTTAEIAIHILITALTVLAFFNKRSNEYFARG